MIQASNYYTVYLSLILITCVLHSIRLWNNSNLSLFNKRKSAFPIMLIAIAVTLFLGLRPIDVEFVDTIVYAEVFKNFKAGFFDSNFKANEPLFLLVTYICSKITDINGYFLFLEVLYVAPIFIACIKLAKNNIATAFLFFLSSFSFYSYGVNGLRNGIATSLIMLSISFLYCTKPSITLCLTTMIAGVLFHNSALLPGLAMWVAYFYKGSYKLILYVWICAIFISIISGSSIDSLFTHLNIGGDNRLEEYISHKADKGAFSHTGFRYDFLIYSSLPILIGIYFVFKKKLFDDTYIALLTIYTISNTFWVLIMRANYSNRFAYLSWFMMPILICYPFIKFKFAKNQGAITSIILLAHIGLTIVLSNGL